MKLEVSNKTSELRPKLHIKKGFYHARLAEVKPKEKEGKYGKMLIMLFDIIDEKYRDSDGNYAQLAKLVYHTYKDQDSNEYRTAVTPNSKITKIFQNLGWKFDEEGLDTDKFLGAEAEVLVNEYDYDYTDPHTGIVQKLKASTIDEVNKWEAVTQESL